jgi:hypothetical protein
VTGAGNLERDLWWVISDDRDAARYKRRTGWAVNQDALALYRLRWGLDDLAEFLSEIRSPHQETAGTLVSWTALQETLESIVKCRKPRKADKCRPILPTGRKHSAHLQPVMGGAIF